jgi:23S rRNA G2069 N7-methylase RlmK/C1962 C5-methylase RlmI
VLNLFCYTAAFSVYAAAGGAAETDSVDLSNTYLDWAKENFRLNGFTASSHRLIRADALSFLDQADAAKRRWDLVILDPPAFSNSKKMRVTLDMRRDHGELIARCLKLLSPGGKLFFSAGAKNFRPEFSAFPGFAAEDLRTRAADEDFPLARAPACFLFQNTDSST